MGDLLRSLYYRLTSGAYDLPAVVVELLLIGLCVHWVAGVLHGTRGTRPLRGVLIILVGATLIVRVVTAQFEWERLNLLYSYLLYSLAFIALVVFQPELRRAIIRVGDVRLRRAGTPESQVIAALVKAAGYLSRNRYGALIAIQRSVDLRGWAENGTILNAEVSANLLNNIFFPNSPLHDLGVIIDGTRIVAANCQFPSAESDEVDTALGSRHLAAVGMSYETDALVLVISEETGVVSLADNGRLTRYLSLDDLAEELSSRLAGHAQRIKTTDGQPWHRRLWGRARHALVVVPLTLVIWYVADQATFVTDTCQVRLEVRHEDPGREVEILGQPLVFEATFTGSGRSIDRLRATYAKEPMPVTWVTPHAYGPRPEAYAIEAREGGIRKLLENAREIRERGLTVTDVGLARLTFQVFERTTVVLPVDVRTEGGPVRIALERAEPPTVTVDVRRDDLRTLEAQGRVYATLGRQLEGLSAGDVRTFRSVAVSAPAGLTGPARLTPDKVTVTVRVVAQPTLVRNVVVRPFVSPEVAERYRVVRNDLNEWRIDVEVQRDEAVFDALSGPEIDAFVHVSADLLPGPDEPPEELFRTLPVIFTTPKGVSVVGSRSVQVTLVPRTAEGG